MQPRPLCQGTRPVTVADGTMCRNVSPPPGTLGGSAAAAMRDYLCRIGNVKDAFLLGITKYAYSASLAKLGEDLQLLLDSLWPGLVDAFKIYAVSIGAGAVVFGTVGGVFSGGAAVVPAAFAGAVVGTKVATLILTILGLKFLAEYVLAHLDAANKHFGRGVELAWDASCENPVLDPAAREFGDAIAELVSLVLQAAAAYVIKKGLKAGLEELNKSKMGKAMAPYAKVQYWREKLGVSDAPVPRQGIGKTIEFFEQQIEKKKLDPMKEEQLLSYWKAKDFSKPISNPTLKPGKELVAYRDPKSPFGYYYTEPGTYLNRVGVDYKTVRPLPEGVQGPVQLVPREFIRYRVKQAVEVLQSTSSGVRSHDTHQPVPGGGTQYFIPRAWEVLEIVK